MTWFGCAVSTARGAAGMLAWPDRLPHFGSATGFGFGFADADGDGFADGDADGEPVPAGVAILGDADVSGCSGALNRTGVAVLQAATEPARIRAARTANLRGEEGTRSTLVRSMSPG
jgi:hypothetical protein